jgi:hypothetical protein
VRILGAIASVLGFALVWFLLGYWRGRLDGYVGGWTRGKRDSDNWWYRVEQDVQKEREKIWREG